MSISRDGIDINIRTKFDGTGAEQAETSIQKQIASAAGLSTAYREAAASAQFLAAAEQGRHAQAAQTNATLTAEQGTVAKSAHESAAAFESLLPPLNQASAATEQLTGKKKVLKEALKQASHSLPELGQLLLFLKNPITIAAGAVAVLAGSFKHYLDTLDEMEQSLSVHERVSKAMYTLGGAAADAATELGDFSTELGQAGEEGAAAADKINKVITAIQKLEEMQAEKRSAEEGLELAGVNEDERAGRISKGDAIRTRTAIKEKYIKLAEEAKVARLEEEQETRKEALRNTQLKTQDAERELPGAVKAAATAKRVAIAAIAKEDSDLAANEEQKKKVAKELAGNKESLDGYNMKLLEQIAAVAPAGSAAAHGPAAYRAQALEKIDELEIEMARLEREEAAIRATREKAEANVKPTRDRANELKEEVKTGRNNSGRLWEEIEKGGRDIETYRWHRGKLTPLEKRARRIESDSEAEGTDRDDEEKRQREAEKYQRGTRRNFSLDGGDDFAARLDIPNAGAFANASRQIEGALQDQHEANMGVLVDLRHRIESHTREIAAINARFVKNQQLG